MLHLSKYCFSRQLIIISYLNNFNKFTYLDFDYNHIQNAQIIVNRQPGLSASYKLIWMINQHSNLLSSLKNIDIYKDDLMYLNNDSSGQKKLQGKITKQVKLNKNKLCELAEQYKLAKEQLKMRIVDDSVPLVDLLYLISTLAYLDVDLWQKSIAKILVCYLKIDLPLQKVYMQQMTHYIVYKFQNFYGNSIGQNYRFKLQQLYLGDLTSINRLLKIFLLSLDKYDDDGETYDNFLRASKLHYLFKIYQKLQHVLDINLYRTGQRLTPHLAELSRFVRKCQVWLAIEIMYMISMWRIQAPQVIINAHQNIAKNLQQYLNNPQIIEKNALSKIRYLFESWKNLQKIDYKIYSGICLPYIQTLLSKESSYYLQLLNGFISLLTNQCFPDSTLLMEILNKLQIYKVKQSNLTHWVKHYLSIVYGCQLETTYGYCVQNQDTVAYLKKHKRKIYSSCMLQCQSTGSHLQTKIDIDRQVHPRQFHKGEQFWAKAIRKAFDNELDCKYPSVEQLANKFYHQYKFCVFEIDFVLILQGQFIGIEFEGMHYYMESNKQGENWSRHKDKILRAYGVHIVKMKSSDFLVRSYNQLNDSDSAAKLIIEVIDQAMKELLEREKQTVK